MSSPRTSVRPLSAPVAALAALLAAASGATAQNHGAPGTGAPNTSAPDTRAPARGADGATPEEPPQTAAERSGYAATSTTSQVRAFLDEVVTLEHGDRLRVEVVGSTEEERDLLLVTAARPMPAAGADLRDDPRLRILINANIHGGEVEGKEVVQELLRDLALGQHQELLDDAIFMFVPVYNGDGNDRIDPKNRVSQNGPDDGVGQRPNANDLDLNRDFIKAESAECQTMLSLFRRHDPHVFVDLHTTNGSQHAYHLTWAPSLSTNVAPALDSFARGTLLPGVQQRCLDKHEIRTFPYGNLTGRNVRRWITYDHRPRFGTNYYGLRNRLGILSEAYSYTDFETRIRATRAFVLELLRGAIEHSDTIRSLCAAADRAVSEPSSPTYFSFDTTYGPGHQEEVLLCPSTSIETEYGTRRQMGTEHNPTELIVADAFYSRRSVALPQAWAIPDPTARITELLSHHGIQFETLAAPRDVTAATFEATDISKGRRPFQGHLETRVEGQWATAQATTLAPGTLLIPAHQPLARLAAQLLEPHSEDSAITWNALSPTAPLRVTNYSK